MLNKAILVAHGNGGEGTFSIPNVKTITRSNELLSFDTAKQYMSTSKTWPEYSSTNYGEFGGLTDDDCKAVFNKVPAGSGIVSTGLRRGGDMAGAQIYTYRGAAGLTQAEITDFIKKNSISSLVLLACRWDHQGSPTLQ